MPAIALAKVGALHAVALAKVGALHAVALAKVSALHAVALAKVGVSPAIARSAKANASHAVALAKACPFNGFALNVIFASNFNNSMIARLISSILSGVWLMDPAKAEGYYPVVFSLLEGKFKADEFRKRSNSEEDEYDYFSQIITGTQKKLRSSWDTRMDDINEDAVLVIPVLGPVSKYDYCGSPGTNTISSFLKAAAQNENVKGFIFHVDSPGGEADGTRNLSETIAGLGKPTVAWIDGMAASAAYWIVSATDKIIANLDTDEIGSIGTYVQFGDFRGYYEKNGIKVHTVYATKSINKNKSFRDALDGKYDALKAEIDVINESFINGVKNNRANKIIDESVFSGKLYFAEKAIEAGLIDEIGSFDAALSEIELLSNNHKFSKSMWISKEKYDAAIAAAKAEGAKEAQTRIEELESQITEMEASDAANLQEQLNTANETIQTQTTEIADLKTQVSELTAKIPTTKVDGKEDELSKKEGEFLEDEPIY